MTPATVEANREGDITMNNDKKDGGTNFLLLLILIALIGGGGAVMGFLQILLWIAGGLIVLFLVLALLGGASREGDIATSDTEKGGYRPLAYCILFVAGMFLLFGGLEGLIVLALLFAGGFVLWFAVFMVVGMLKPPPPGPWG